MVRRMVAKIAAAERKVVENVAKVISDNFPEAKVSIDKFDKIWVDIPSEKLVEFAKFVKEKLNCTYITTITGRDDGKQYIELLYHMSPEIEGRYVYLTVRIKVPRDKPEVPTLSNIFPPAELYEREVYDLLGVKFIGHPNLKRLLLPETLPEGYHPLRKDFKGPTLEEELSKERKE